MFIFVPNSYGLVGIPSSDKVGAEHYSMLGEFSRDWDSGRDWYRSRDWIRGRDWVRSRNWDRGKDWVRGRDWDWCRAYDRGEGLRRDMHG